MEQANEYFMYKACKAMRVKENNIQNIAGWLCTAIHSVQYQKTFFIQGEGDERAIKIELDEATIEEHDGYSFSLIVSNANPRCNFIPRYSVAMYGDWIVELPNGDFITCSNDEFQENFAKSDSGLSRRISENPQQKPYDLFCSDKEIDKIKDTCFDLENRGG